MELRFIKWEAEVPAGCVEIFYHSEIYDRYFRAEGKLARVLQRAAEAGELYLALDAQDRPLGVLKMSMRGVCGLYPYLGLLGIHPDSRGLGVGSFMLRQAEVLARESGAKRITLMVADFNRRAMGLYEHLGYREMGRCPGAVLPDVAEVLMVKDITI